MRLLGVVAAVLSLTACKITTEAYFQDAVAEATAAGAPVIITRAYTSTPNAAGGVDLVIYAANTTNKTIKYIEYDAQAFNAVGDPVRGTIRNSRIVGARETGPIRPGANNSFGNWQNLWYNHSIKCARLTMVKVIYMDGSSKTLRGQSLKNILVQDAYNEPC